MTPQIHYRISVPEPNSHYFHVQIRIERPDPNGQVLRLPTWIPGSYLIREFARHLQTVTASSAGQSVKIVKTDKATWQCEPVAGGLIVVYKVYAFDRSVRSAYLDNTRAFFNGSSVFLQVVGQENEPGSLQIEKITHRCAEQWSVATTYPAVKVDAQGFGDFAVDNYKQLIDHPVEISDLTQTGFKVDNIPHQMVFTGSHKGDMDRLAQDVKKICATHVKMFGELPVSRYLFMTLVGQNIYGGLEHKDSTALMCSRHELPQADSHSGSGNQEFTVSNEYRRFLGLCSHEYFHLWNVKRIMPEAYLNTDLASEAYTRQLWIFEGITSYYDDLALVRSGVITSESYLELLGNTLNRVRNQAGRLKQSLAESSFDTWIKFYRPNENTPNTVVSYYAQGSLAALALDVTLQTQTEGKRSLDDVMRYLWEHYGKKAVGLPEGKFEQICAELSGLDLTSFFDDWIRGKGDQAIISLLSGIGIKSESRHDDSHNKLTAYFGCDVEMRGPQIFIKTVYSASAAEQAGLAAGDELVAFDGQRINRVSLQTLFKQYQVGDKAEVLAFRQGQLLKLNIGLQQALKQKWTLAIDETAELRAQQLRNKWLWKAAG
ncbi:MAG: M61 family metallopeptidase [Gammaproteobacteria bacterium]|nr:PDZ domain-containing protein [Gammaproteobacteria bacterium]NNC97013.1 M61 family metallopeptidase [Gammaproteobacteria bacterium]NNM14372.1 M61 family metallopeptidase [Gammaproteobacteria bacterium]